VRGNCSAVSANCTPSAPSLRESARTCALTHRGEPDALQWPSSGLPGNSANDRERRNRILCLLEEARCPIAHAEFAWFAPALRPTVWPDLQSRWNALRFSSICGRRHVLADAVSMPADADDARSGDEHTEHDRALGDDRPAELLDARFEAATATSRTSSRLTFVTAGRCRRSAGHPAPDVPVHTSASLPRHRNHDVRAWSHAGVDRPQSLRG